MNSSEIKWIAARLRRKVTDQKQGKRVRVLSLPEFLAEAGSEASLTESPRFEDVVGGGDSTRRSA